MHTVLVVIVLTLTPTESGVSVSHKAMLKRMPSLETCEALATQLKSNKPDVLIVPSCITLSAKELLLL